MHNAGPHSVPRFSPRSSGFVLTASNHGMVIVNRNDYCMVDETSGFGVGYQILNLAEYDRSQIANLCMLLSYRRALFGNGVVAIDCGANIGIFTIEMAKFMRGWGSVVAIEAQERLFYALAGNIALGNCANARAVFAAVGAEMGSISVPTVDYLQPASFGSLELHETDHNEFIGQRINYQEEHCNRVKMVTIDSMDLSRVDLIKIDIEGMELEALEGAQKTIEIHKPQMIIEKCKVDESVLRRWLVERGYYAYSDGANFIAVHKSDDTCNRLMVAGK